jgi:release factor glutamine methyltransferase
LHTLLPTTDTPHSLLVSIAATLRSAGCVYAEDEARLLIAADRPRELAAMVERRAAGLPLEYILGWAEFCGLRIALEPGVFIPRRRTEFLAQQAAAIARPGATVLDLCCGSGAVGAALASALDRVELHAADIESAAVRCARGNLARWHGRVHQGDLYAPLPSALKARVDLLVVNAPYVPSAAIETMPREARIHEPRVSLDGGPDGLQVQRRVAAEALQWLAPGGHLLMETSEAQAAHTAEIFRRGGLTAQIIRSDDWDATVVIGARPNGSTMR